MARRAAAAAHAGLEAHRIRQHELGAIDRSAFGECKQRGEHRRARVQDDAAHVGIVVIQHVSHLAVRQRCIEQAEP
jgi:hypothetical protein